MTSDAAETRPARRSRGEVQRAGRSTGRGADRKPKRPRPPKTPDGRMAVMDHLRELRRRLVWALAFVAIGAVVGWVLYPHTLHFLEDPYCSVPTKYRANLNGSKTCDLVYHGALDGITTRLKVSAISGIVFTAPFWLYQLWAFITPGLKRGERRYTLSFIALSTILFAAGMSLAYLVLAKGLRAVLQLSGSGTTALLTVSDYISFVTLMLVVFGAAFELPLLVVLANFAGVLPAKVLRKSQRIAIFLIFLFAAVATPTTDPFTMCAMAIPMALLYEGAVGVAIVHDRRKAARKAAEQAEREANALPDDVASTIDPMPERLEPDRPALGSSSSTGWSDIT